MSQSNNHCSSFELIDQKLKHHQAIIEHHQAIFEEHQAIVINLKVQRNRLENRLAPISKIPPEVLDNIFFVASRDVDGHGLEWTKLTYVSHDWRNLALSSPSLWCNPPFQSPPWAREMLIRSKTLSLTIEAGASIFTNSCQRRVLYNALEAYMPRIKCIKITLPPEATDLFEHLRRSAPKLVSLFLHSSKHHPPALSHLSLHGSLREMGHLQSMDVSRISIDWNSHLPSSLTSLKLSHLPHSSLPTMTQVWNALERMPLLETLHLTEAFPLSPVPIAPDRKIRLVRLQDLTLKAGIAEMECFLQTVSFPPTAVVSVECWPLPLQYDNVREIIKLLGQSLEDYPTQIKSVVISYQGWAPCLEIRVPRPERDEESHQLQNPKKRSPFYLAAFWNLHDKREVANITGEKMIILSFQHFPFLLVNHLAFSSTQEISLATLLHTVGSLPLLQTLKVKVGPTVLAALQSHLPVSGHDKSCISFPSLLSLKLVRTTFTEKQKFSWGKVSIESLVSCLVWREQHGVPLKKIDVVGCNRVNEDKVNHLREVVAEVEWDRIEQGCASDSDFQVLDN